MLGFSTSEKRSGREVPVVGWQQPLARDQAPMTEATLEALPIRMRATAMQVVPASIGRQLRQLYDDFTNEPIPTHLLVLVRRLENLAT